jgi:predicted ATPase/DNA-binding CsgD family transcriptional regulator
VNRAASTLPRTLPAPLIGRAAELALIRKRFLEDGVRVLTLTGPAGTGKTRLALEAARSLTEICPDGAILVDLSRFGDWRLVLPAIARALGLKRSGSGLPFGRVVEALDNRESLLLLDNFEHLLNAAPMVSDLIAACPGLRAVVTSREQLRISWEHAIRVSPLDLPMEPACDYEAAAAAAAVELFLQRARAVRSGFRLTDENFRAIAEICARLDGLPLAIVLAASRMNVLSPEEVAARLDRRLELLTGGSRDAPSRHHELRAAFEWSYALLDPAEQALFRRLGIFAAGCSVEAVVAVYPDVPESRALDLGIALCEKNLLAKDESVSTELRFRMLETVREFAVEQLAANEEVEATAERASHYYLDFLQRGQSQLGTEAEAESLRRFDREQDNLRVALRWLASHDHVEMAMDMAASMATFWALRAEAEEGRMWLSSVLSLPDAQKDSPARKRAVAAAADLATDGLTPREIDVLRLIAQGLGNKEISRQLYLSLGTVQTHLANIYRKLDLHSRAAATAYVFTHRLDE